MAKRPKPPSIGASQTPLFYVGTALDNSTNMLGPEVVHMVNEFITRTCAVVKVELSPELRN
jgi:hypothetical protein